MAITTADPIRLLDLTRLVSRAGRPLTGVDRVEYAWLDHLCGLGLPFYGLARTSLGYVLLDARGCSALRDRVRDGKWGPADPLSRLVRGIDPGRARAEADLRRLCIARCVKPLLGRMLRRHLPRGVHYVNLGHTNLTDRVIAALKSRESRIAVLVHDTIPLDAPQYQRPGAVDRFAAFLARVGRCADAVICNSEQTRADVARHLGTAMPEAVVAPLGIDVAAPGVPPEGPWTQPYFVTVGTIEPRKNHALLLDLWPEIPDAHLLICGSRGWENHRTFARLDARPKRVHELPGLSDTQIAALLAGSAGMLFPSLAEGYGLPPAEAAALGVPVLCNDLPIYREVLGNIPVYADASDRYLWRNKIREMAAHHRAGQDGRGQAAPIFDPPTWESHFNKALTLI
ncbi:glycosyltransferase family 4 protein [Ponticoccus alexandrii]|uniref:Glycosyltransferase n=1 Tax=Ponticoccus alexandrii TaxID=1943633 RepID=A0ABX7F5D7_9RHOB|nr:glycosyltransferase family 1 protein [Ponticoccus alexandrii]QRF65011.1 glycosyltransferase [Ponticoccus alexandrii]